MPRILSTLALVPVLLLGAGCGDQQASTATSGPASGSGSPAPSGAGASSAGAGGAAPTWPPDCKQRSVGQIDYFADAQGAPTPEEALAHVQPPGTTITKSARGTERFGWLFVDADGYIVKAASLSHSQGWMVTSVEECGQGSGPTLKPGR